MLEGTFGLHFDYFINYKYARKYENVAFCIKFLENANYRQYDYLLPKGHENWCKFKFGSEYRMAERYFSINFEDLLKAYFKLKWGVGVDTGMRICCTFNFLNNDFVDFFKKRREAFMKDNRLEEIKPDSLTIHGKLPHSHGGVANLLKVLTRTMKEQHSGIESIAKMQYAICMQAGIYIVPEFLTDVLVAKEMMEETE